MKIPVLYQDSDIVVVDKPAGIPTHAPDPGDPYPGDALRIVQAQTGLSYLGMHQRLDADTSGVLLFAARRDANKALAAAFEGRDVRKVYLALVHGAPPWAEGVIDAPIAREHGERYRTTTPGDPRGLAARTRYRVLDTYSVLRSASSVESHEQRFLRQPRNTQHAIRNTTHDERSPTCTLLELIPETGRPHQIRVHLAYIGCPVVGDPLYGPADRPAPRLYLHAYQLTVPHPATGQPVTFTAPVPEVLRADGSGETHGGGSHPAGAPDAGARPAISGTDGHAGLAATAHENTLLGPVCDRARRGSVGDRPQRAIFRAADTRAADGATAPAGKNAAKHPDRSPGGSPGAVEGCGAILGARPHPSTSAGSLMPASAQNALFFRLGVAHIRDAMAAPDALRALLRLAVERRAPLAADPQTDIYRLVNGTSDGLPGLTVDRYAGALVAAIYDDDNVVPPRPIPESLVEMLAEITGARAIYVKYRPRQASRIADDQLATVAPARPICGPDLGEFVAREEGLAYVIRPGEGLSTGLFPDMRESRSRVRAWAAGRRVLNTFAYTCGFGVAATAGGAQRVLNLDLSKSVLEWGQGNYRANGFEPDPHDFVFGDVFDWLARLAKRSDRFDLVILDPPGFSRTKSRAFSAARDYGELAGLAARVTTPGGSILACCNVAELPWKSFRERVLAGVAAAGRTAAVNGVYHEPALDFPTPRGQDPYLKMLLLRVT